MTAVYSAQAAGATGCWNEEKVARPYAGFIKGRSDRTSRSPTAPPVDCSCL